jgi:hypothetical protein
VLSSALTVSCGLYGPESIRATRTDYNVSIQQTNEQELLLNLVRLKYRDTPSFLSIDNVASSLEYNRSVAASATVPSQGITTFNLGAARIELFEKPTAIYRPLEGKEFVRRLMTPLDLEVLILLANSGWPADRLFLVTLQEMNGLRNAPTASGPTPEREPEYRAFREAVEHLRSLQLRKQVELAQVVSKSKPYLELRFTKEDANDPHAIRFKHLLRLAPERDHFKLLAGIGVAKQNAIVVSPRTLIAVMNYLAQGIEVPARDLSGGRVTRTLADSGKMFDWQRVLKGVFKIHSSDEQPSEPAVAIHFRGSWFFINDTDLNSKETFSLLMQLFALQAGEIKKISPAINLLIGR